MNPNDLTDTVAAHGTEHAARIATIASDASRPWPAVAALLLGGLIVLGVGFGPGLLHNAAHDTRHALVFPCH